MFTLGSHLDEKGIGTGKVISTSTTKDSYSLLLDFGYNIQGIEGPL
jgi:hypothetical protein